MEKQKRREKIGKAKEDLEKEAREKAEARGENEEAKPSEKAQRNFTDPESRIMPRAGAFQACAVHNLKKLWKLGWELPSLAAQAA